VSRSVLGLDSLFVAWVSPSTQEVKEVGNTEEYLASGWFVCEQFGRMGAVTPSISLEMLTLVRERNLPLTIEDSRYIVIERNSHEDRS